MQVTSPVRANEYKFDLNGGGNPHGDKKLKSGTEKVSPTVFSHVFNLKSVSRRSILLPEREWGKNMEQDHSHDQCMNPFIDQTSRTAPIGSPVPLADKGNETLRFRPGVLTKLTDRNPAFISGER